MAIITDLAHAWRGLTRRRTYLLASAATLALVLAANASVFAVVSATLLRPMPFAPGTAVAHLFMLPPGLTDVSARNPPQQMDVVRFRERARTLTRIEGFLPGDRVVTIGQETAVVQSATVTAGLIGMLQMRMQQGRPFEAAEVLAAAKVAVITDGYWRRALGGAPVVGRPLVIDGHPHTIVGVLQPGHPPSWVRAEVLVPLVPDATPLGRNPGRSVVTLAELAPGATVEAVDAEVREMVRQLAAEFPRTHGGWTGGAQAARTWQYGAVRTPLLILFGAALLVLLIACANLANLASGHALDRSAETALRLALGATRLDILRLQLAELLIIAAAGLVPGLALASLSLPMLLGLDPVAARSLGPVSVDWRVQAFTASAALGVAALAALAPLLSGRRVTDAALAGRRVAGSGDARRVRRLLVAGEVALCLALLMAGVVLLRGLAATSRHDPGFDARGVLTAQIRLPATTYDTTETRAAVVARILGEVRSLPGVRAAGTTMNPFVPGFAFQTLFHVENRPTADGQPHTTIFRRVSPGYFEAMRIRQLRGRAFTDADTLDSPAVAVISRQLAQQLFPGEDPTGHTLRRTAVDTPPLRIIGVVDDVRDVSLAEPPQGTLYMPWSQNNNAGVPVSFVIRSDTDPVALLPSVRAAVARVAPELPLRNAEPLDTFLKDSVAPERFRATVLGIIATLGLLLAVLGIYAVTYRGVAERTHEFAVRMALGADRSRVLGLVVGDVLRDVALGAGVGVGAGWLLTTALAGAITNVSPNDAVTTWGVVATLLAAALVAALVPSLRILRLAPADALALR